MDGLDDVKEFEATRGLSAKETRSTRGKKAGHRDDSEEVEADSGEDDGAVDRQQVSSCPCHQSIAEISLSVGAWCCS